MFIDGTNYDTITLAAWMARGGFFAGRIVAIVALGMAFVLSGCAATKSLFQPSIALTEVKFDVARNANDSTPIAVEVVAVSDEALLAKMLTMTADQWFDPQSNLRRDYPALLQTWYYELTPGLRMQVRRDPFARRGTRAVLLYAHYKGKGAYRLRLDPYPKASVVFGEKDIALAVVP